MHVLHQHRIRNGMLAGTMAVAIGLVGGTAGAQAAVNCTVSAGVTQVGNLVVGTGGADNIDCSVANPGKIIRGLGGHDVITGTALVDSIDGGTGNDNLNSGPAGSLGSDSMIGGSGNDTMVAYSGNDTMIGGLGNDTMSGGGESTT